MSDDATPRLGLPYLAAAQAQKHVTVNEGLALLDGLVQTAVASRSITAQPDVPVDGDLYILPASASGADWAGQSAGTVMRFEAGAWRPLVPSPGWIVFVRDASELVVYDTAGWVEVGALISSLADLDRVGVNTTADDTNRLAVKSEAILFDHVGQGVQLKLDKASASDTASLLLQTSYSGRAEIGLCGDDHLRIRISPDGAAFADALMIDTMNGSVGLGISSPTSRLHVDGCARVKGYAVAGLPSAADQGAGAILYVSDESGGATLAFSDGADWRRVTDRAVVS